MDWHDLIVSNPDILVGNAAIKGTRISVELILDDLADGSTEEQIAADYGTEVTAVRAAMQFAQSKREIS